MMRRILKSCVVLFVLLQAQGVFAWEGMPMPRLHVEGRYLKDPHGNIVNLHGYAQTFSPWFNERGTQWNNYDVQGCLDYNQGIIDGVLAAGWKMNFVRMHMDPYWSSIPGCQGRYEGEECFSETRFIRYLDQVFVPMAEYAVSKGLYVVFRPPGVCPEEIEIGGVYHEYLIKVWGIVSQHPKLKNHPNIMFELANEPIDILGPHGTYGASSQGHFDNLKKYFQAIVDTIRVSADNILWVPGLGYQSLYSGYAKNPIEGENIGYAVHVYPGWFNSGQGYEPFQRGWDAQVQPIADKAPIMVTEMDWAPAKYDASWGKEVTGTVGGDGFGANFQKIVDDCGNVSWLLFTSPDLLDDFTGIPPAEGEPYTFLNDPEACPWPIFHWYQEYAKEYTPKPEFEYQPNTDNGDGTFNNPVIRGDFPTPVVVRENDIYYMVSVNPEFNPDTTILQSKDLVNWEYSNKQPNEISLENVIYVDDTDIQAGTLIETQTGEWWAMVSFSASPFGDLPNLLPVTWENGNAVIDETAKDAKDIAMPDVGREFIPATLATNDVFRHYLLGNQWGWHGEPARDEWSLLKRAGYLRLTSIEAVDSVHKAQNIISQRILAFPNDTMHSYASVKMEIDSLNEGDVAGLSLFQDSFAYVGVKIIGGEKKVVSFIKNEMLTGETITDSVIYFRAVAGLESDSAGFYYSLDNQTFSQIGTDFSLKYNPELPSGYRFGLFNIATQQVGGFVDIDWFSTENTFSEDTLYPKSFEKYTEGSMTLTDVLVDNAEHISLITSNTAEFTVTAVYQDGHTEDIMSTAEYINHNPEVISISKGTITAISIGEASFDISYTSLLGKNIQKTFTVSVSTFPLTNELFNPGIVGEGTFDDTTKTLRTGKDGFAGWQYKRIDLSDYQYMVARLDGKNAADVEFRVYDGSSYYGPVASFPFEERNEIVVDLHTALKCDKLGNCGTLNPDRIYMVGFWSNGDTSFVVDTVFLSNSSEFDPPEVNVKDVEANDITSLSGFTYDEGYGPSVSQSFTISGERLSDSIYIEVSENFELATDTTEEFSQSITLANTSGQLSETEIFVRLKSDLQTYTYRGEVVISTIRFPEKVISLSGTVEEATSIYDHINPKATVVSTEYYTISGRKIENIDGREGLFIVKHLMSDGSVLTKKVFRMK